MADNDETTPNRWLMVAIATMLMFTVGICYVWSVYQPVVMQTYGWDENTASMTFTVLFLSYVIGSLLGGQMQAKLKLRTSLLVGGAFCFVGAAWSALQDGSSPIALYVSWGGIVGAGLGILYNIAVTVAQQWLPDKRGLASGIVMAGLAVSSVAFAPLFTWLLAETGLATTFWVDAIIMLALALVGAFALQAPPQNYQSQKVSDAPAQLYNPAEQFSPKELVKMPAYYLALTVRMSACVPNILASPLLISLGAEKGLDAGLLVGMLMLANASNALSRLMMGTLSDRIGRKPSLLACFVVCMAGCLGLALCNGLLFPISFVILQWGYGGLVAVQPAAVSDSFGLQHAGVNWGFVTIGLGIASVISMVIGMAISESGLPIETRFFVSIGFIVLGVIATALERKPAPKKHVMP